MTAILFDGFDLEDLVDRWTSGAAGSDSRTTIKRTGTHALRMGSDAVVYLALQPGVDDDVCFLGSGLYAGSSNASQFGNTHVFWEDAQIMVSVAFNNPTRSIRVYRGHRSGGVLLAETPVNFFHFDSWHYLETKVKLHNSAGIVEVRLDGVTVLNFSGDTDPGSVSGKINRVGFMGPLFSGQEVWFDDVYILNEQGTINNDFLSDTRVYPLYPIGDGFYLMLVGSDADSIDNWMLVDEAGTPVTTDYVFSVTPGDMDSYEFQNLPVGVGTIRGIEIRSHAAKNETGTKQIRHLTRRGGSDSFGPDHVLAAIPVYQTHQDVLEQDPHAGPGTWTIPNINATEWGVEVRA